MRSICDIGEHNWRFFGIVFLGKGLHSEHLIRSIGGRGCFRFQHTMIASWVAFLLCSLLSWAIDSLGF